MTPKSHTVPEIEQKLSYGTPPFAKVFLEPGESQTVTIQLDDKAFRYFNVKKNAWEIESGEYEIFVGASVADIRLAQTVTVTREPAPTPYKNLPSYESGKIGDVSDEEFESLLGRPIPDGHWSGEFTANDALCQMYYAKTGLARLVYRILTRMKKKAEDKGKPDLNILFVYNMPFRAIAKMTGGMVSGKMVEDILLMVNGHFWRGLGRVIRDFFRNRKASKAFEAKLGA